MDSNTRGLVFHYSNGNNNKQTGFFGMNMNDSHKYCLYENVEIDTNGTLNQVGSTLGKLKVASPVANDDAATKKYVDDNAGGGGLLKIDGTNAMTASLNAGTNKVINVVDPADAQDAATKKYVDDNTPWDSISSGKIYTNDQVGIGITLPDAALHVFNYTGLKPAHAAWFGQTGIDRLFVIPYHTNRFQVANFHATQSNTGMGIANGAFTSNLPISIISEQSIWCKWAIVITSDSRIKEEIEDVEDAEALNIVNKIPCRKYFYKTRYTEHKIIGFIAQEVREHLPEAVKIKNCVAPDELRHIEPPVWNGNILTINDITFNEEHTGLVRFIVSDEENVQGKQVELSVNDDKKSFTFEKSWNFVFLYGKEVNDFHSLDKNMIFALHHSAIQEVDRQLQAEKVKTATLETTVADLVARITALENA